MTWVIVTAPTDRGGDVAAAGLAELRRRRPDWTVRTAVLGGPGPTVTRVLDEASAAGAERIVLCSGQTLADRKMQAWFRRVVGHWLRERNGSAPDVRIAGELADGAGFADLLEAAVDGPTTAASSRTAPLCSPLWDEVPGFRRHVLVCRGPRCSALGGAEAQAALDAELRRRDLGDDDVLVTVTGCLFPCSQAPVLVVYPDDAWYSGADATRVPRIVDEHLVGGRVVEELLGRRRS